MPVAAAFRSHAAWSSRNASKSANTTSSHSGGVLKRRSSIGPGEAIAETRECRKCGSNPGNFGLEFGPASRFQRVNWRVERRASLPDHVHDQAADVRRCAVLPQVKRLPSAE